MKAIFLLPFIVLLAGISCGQLRHEPAITVTNTHAPDKTIVHTEVPTNSSQEPQLVGFVSESGKFQARLPDSQNIIEFTSKNTLFGELIECPNLFFRLNGAGAIVRYCDLAPQSITSLSSDEILEQAENKIIRSMHLKPETREQVLAQDKYPATTFGGEVNLRGMGYDGTFEARLVLVENRIYLVLMSVYHENWCKCIHQINEVVNSLYIDPDLSIPFEPTP